MALTNTYTVDYTNKRITYTSGGAVDTVRDLYSWLMDTFDELSSLQYFICMTALTPFEFSLVNGWFIDEETIKTLKGGSIITSDWTHPTNATGIRILTLASITGVDNNDLGKTVTGVTTGHTGKLLAYNNTDKKLWVRCNTASDLFNNATENINVDGVLAGAMNNSASVTGENIWANIYTLGSLQSNTDVYVLQNFTKITSWWPTGHIDILVKVQEMGTLIDYGLLVIFARQYTKSYDHYSTDLSSGGRNPIPLSTFKDLNNPTGYLTVNFDNGNLGFTLAQYNVISVSGTARAVVTSVTGGGSETGSFEYYLINTLTDFSNNEAFTASPSGKTGQIDGSSSSFGPALLTGISFTFGAVDKDIDDGYGPQPYDLIIDGNSKTVKEVYERTKYLTRRASMTSLNEHYGEQYIATGYIKLNMQTNGGFTEGLKITGGTSGATGYIVGNHSTSLYFLVVRDVRGTFADNETVTDTDIGSASTAASGAVETFDISKSAPFATFAGGRFFGSRGVWLENVSDANNFELIDSKGEPRTPPSTISLTVDGLASGDRVGLFRAIDSNGVVNKSMFTINAPQGVGSSTIVVNSAIPADTPAKTGPSGVIRVVRRTASGTIINEQRYTYTSWTGSTFTLLSGTTTSYAYDTTDTVYVPYIDEQAISDSISKNVIYAGEERDVVIRVRQKGILPFEQKGKKITSSGFSATAIRTDDIVVV